MKRFLLAGAAAVAFSSASFAADLPPVAPYEAVVAPVDVWSGYFVGIQVGGASGEADLDFWNDGLLEDSTTVFDHGFIGGLFYGRNWQSGNIVFGLDSSFTYLGWSEDLDNVADGRPEATVSAVDIDADFLGLTRLKVGYAFDNINIFVAGGLATTIFDADITTDSGTTDDDDWAFGWTVGAGVEAMISDNWSARLEGIYASIESDDLKGLDETSVEADLEVTIIRAGLAYHF